MKQSSTLPLVSVVIPHYAGTEILSECLISLNNCSYPNLEIIVVDNASLDGSVQFIKTNFPDINLIQSEYNRGFAGGCNFGAQHTAGEYLLILNKMDDYFPNDVIPTTDAELDIQIGRIYMQAGKPEELKNRLKTVQQRKDISLETQMYIGQIFMNDFQDYDAAIEHYENLLDEYPYIPDFLYTLVQAYAKAERRSEAVDVLELWLRSHPNDSQAIDWLSILNPPTQ